MGSHDLGFSKYGDERGHAAKLGADLSQDQHLFGRLEVDSGERWQTGKASGPTGSLRIAGRFAKPPGRSNGSDVCEEVWGIAVSWISTLTIAPVAVRRTRRSPTKPVLQLLTCLRPVCAFNHSSRCSRVRKVVRARRK